MHGPVPLPGDLVWIRRRRWRVERARRDRHVVRLDVAARDRRLTFLSPFDRVFTVAGAPPPRRVRPQEALARLAHLIATPTTSRLPSAQSTRVADILPHQLEPAMAMIAGQSRDPARRRSRARQDDPGRARRSRNSCGAIRRSASWCSRPPSLRDQWTTNCSQRFRTPMSRRAIDPGSMRSRAPARFGDNPWRPAGHLDRVAGFSEAAARRRRAAARPVGPRRHRRGARRCGDSDRYELVSSDRVPLAARRFCSPPRRTAAMKRASRA